MNTNKSYIVNYRYADITEMFEVNFIADSKEQAIKQFNELFKLSEDKPTILVVSSVGGT